MAEQTAALDAARTRTLALLRRAADAPRTRPRTELQRAGATLDPAAWWAAGHGGAGLALAERRERSP